MEILSFGLDDTVLFPDVLSRGPRSVNLGILAPNRSATLPDGRLAIVASQHPTLWILQHDLRISPGIQLIGPGLRAVPRESGELVIYSVAADSTGDIFCAISPYKGAEGAKILQFDISGKLKQYLRLVMPGFGDTRNRGDGRMLASHIGVTGNEIYVASSSSIKSRCAVYKIPVSGERIPGEL